MQQNYFNPKVAKLNKNMYNKLWSYDLTSSSHSFTIFLKLQIYDIQMLLFTFTVHNNLIIMNKETQFHKKYDELVKNMSTKMYLKKNIVKKHERYSKEIVKVYSKYTQSK